MFRKFQYKLLAAFALLIVLIILPVVVFVNSTIARVSERRIEDSLRTSQRVLESFLESRRRSFSEIASALITLQPTLRAVLGTSNDQSDELFGGAKRDAASESARFRETNEVLYSAVESLDLFRKSGVFVMTDAKGRVLFSKAAPKTVGDELTSLAIVRAALDGREVHTVWAPRDATLEKLPLLPRAETSTLYEVFFKPIVFGRDVSGLIIVGFAVTPEDISRIRDITQSEIAFTSGGAMYGNSTSLSLDPRRIASEQQRESVGRFRAGDEDYIALVSPLVDSLGTAAGASIIYRSKTRELAFFRSLGAALTEVAGVAGLLAILIALFISGGVTGSIRILIRGVEAVRAGNLDHVVTVRARDEFASLASAFNTMTQGLREKETIKSTFKRYVNPKVVNTLLAGGESLRLGGDRREVVIYFADIAGFTKISEALTPEETIEFLNEYLSAVTAAIEDGEGIVDKYIGDAVMAYWLVAGSGNARAHACRAALHHARIARELRERWKGRKGLSDFHVRIGINAGQAIMGNIGSESRMDYTLIGDDVNASARLESANKAYGSSVLVSESVAKGLADEFLFRELDFVRVKGKATPIRIYELLGDETAEAPLRSRVMRFQSALTSYRAADFRTAVEAFTDLRREDPDDDVARVFADRCAAYVAKPPPPGWDGVHQLTEK